MIPTAFYIPPKPDQAFLQGGTFVFRGPHTYYAHYDPSTASHAPLQDVLDVAQRSAAINDDDDDDNDNNNGGTALARSEMEVASALGGAVPR